MFHSKLSEARKCIKNVFTYHCSSPHVVVMQEWLSDSNYVGLKKYE